jgi:hypothetical protein
MNNRKADDVRNRQEPTETGFRNLTLPDKKRVFPDSG